MAARGRVGRFERRILASILAVGLVSIVVALVLGRLVIAEAIAVGFNERVRTHVARSLPVYRGLIETRRDLALVCARAIVDSRAIAAAIETEERSALEQAVRGHLERCASVGRVHLRSADGRTLIDVRRADRLDATRRRLRTIEQDLPGARGQAHVAVTIGIDARLFTDYARAGEVEHDYGLLARARDELERLYLLAFTGMLGLVTALAVAVGLVVARRVTRRVGDLASAVGRVAAGDLGVRVPIRSDDEIADLTRAFNDMLRELGESRERIEYLSRVGAWQEFARRLAHEIKNPLTPIQLAVQQVHTTWGRGPERPGFDPEVYGRTVNDARAIVEEEVATLRRLVGEFSAFAKLPEAQLSPGDLVELARDCQQSLAHLGTDEATLAGSAPVELSWELPDTPVAVRLDPMMLKRVLDNLVRNAVQAVCRVERPAGAAAHVVVAVRRTDHQAILEVRDDGPGVPQADRAHVFDPYFTTRSEGTGLGLAIVRKVVLEHGGDVVCLEAPEGGARFTITLPLEA